MLLQLLTYFRVNLMFIFFSSLFWHCAAVQWSLRMKSCKDPIRKSTTGDYAPSSSTGPRSTSFKCVKWYYLRAKSENVGVVAALSSSTFCVTFYLKNEQEVNITGFVRWRSRLRATFQYKYMWNLRAGSKNFCLVAASSSREIVCVILSYTSKKWISQDLFGEALGWEQRFNELYRKD